MNNDSAIPQSCQEGIAVGRGYLLPLMQFQLDIGHGYDREATAVFYRWCPTDGDDSVPSLLRKKNAAQNSDDFSISKQVIGGGAMSPIGAPIPHMAPALQSTVGLSGEEPPIGHSKRHMRVAVDTEWYVDGKQRRHILSYQLATRAGDGEVYAMVVLLPDSRDGRGSRMTLQRTLAVFIQGLAHIGVPAYYKPEQALSDGFKRKNHFYVDLVGHYGIVDHTAFHGFKIKGNLDTIRKTLVSIEKPVFGSGYLKTTRTSLTYVILVRDTLLLAPAGKQSLEALGEALGHRKLTLPDGYSKDAMHTFRKERPLDFIGYAANDSLVTLAWVEGTIEKTGTIPVTSAAYGARKTRDLIMQLRGFSVNDFDLKVRGIVTRTQDRHKIQEHHPATALYQQAMLYAFYGGRNEASVFGLHGSPEGWSWVDWDLAGAYPLAMSLLPDIEWEQAPTTMHGKLSLNMVHPLQAGVGYVRFRFPENTRHPCLPVKDRAGRGLIFPLEGETWATSPEVWAALLQGAEIETINGWQIPVVNQQSHVWADALIELTLERLQAKALYGKGSLMELLAKEIINSVYGKTGQGIAGKRSYSTRKDASVAVPPSILTCPPVAALTTGLVRMVVSLAMMECERRGWPVGAVTTDGFLVCHPKDVHFRDLPLAGFRETLQEARARLAGGDPTIWEEKHRTSHLAVFKTRGNAGDNPKAPAAGAGYRMSNGQYLSVKSGETSRSETLLGIFLERDGLIETGYYQLPAPSDYTRKGADGVGKETQRKISWEFDYKRKPNFETVEVACYKGIEHVGYRTDPYKDWEEFNLVREEMDEVRHRPVKTKADAEEVDARIQRAAARKEAGIKAKGGTMRNMAVHVLRGIRAGLLCGSIAQEPPESILEAVSEAFGVVLNMNDWKHAGRAERQKNIVLDGAGAYLEKLGLALAA